MAEMGFDWNLVSERVAHGRGRERVSRAIPEWRKEFEQTLADLREEGYCRIRIRDHRLCSAFRSGGRRLAGTASRAASKRGVCD